MYALNFNSNSEVLFSVYFINKLQTIYQYPIEKDGKVNNHVSIIVLRQYLYVDKAY